MPAVQTAEREIDRKLYEIFKATTRSIRDATELAEAVRQKKPRAFLYVREGEEEVAGERTIERYIRFTVEIELLDSKCQPLRKKKEVQGLEGFQNWLGDQAQVYLDANGCSADDIRRVARQLINGAPAKLPTDKAVHQGLDTKIELGFFRFATRLLTELKPEDYTVRSRPVFLIPKVVEEVATK